MNPGIHLSDMIKSVWRQILHFWHQVTAQVTGWASFFVYFYLNTELSQVLPAVMRSLWINSCLVNGRDHRAFYFLSCGCSRVSAWQNGAGFSLQEDTDPACTDTELCSSHSLGIPWLHSPAEPWGGGCTGLCHKAHRGHVIIVSDEKSLSWHFCCSQVKEGSANTPSAIHN